MLGPIGSRDIRVVASIVLVALLGILPACRRSERASPAPSAEASPVSDSRSSENPDPTATPTTSTPTATLAPTDPEGTLAVWHSWSQRDSDALGLSIEVLKEEYPDLKIDTLFVAPNDLLQTYAQAVAAGGGPDIVLAPNWWLSDLQTLGAVRPLDEALLGETVSALWPAAAENLRIDGRLFGVPTNYETVALFYNRALVGDGDIPGTLDELRLAAQSDPRLGIGIYANPFHISWGFPAYGAQMFDEAGHAILEQSAGSAQFLEWLASVNSLDGSYVDSDYGMLLDRFKRGEFAYLIDGPWAISDLQSALGPELGVAAIPAGPVGPSRPWMYADAAYVNPNMSQEQTELVQYFLKHLTGTESSKALAEFAGRLPANRSTSVDGTSLQSGFAVQAATADPMPHGAHMDAFWRYGGDMILRSLAGSEDVQSVVAETAALTNDASGR